MIRALLTGTIYGEPQARTSQAGKKYATAKVRAEDKAGATVWCSLVAFGELADRLLTLAQGAALSISGKAELNAYTNKQGEPKAGLSLVVDDLATLKGKPRPSQGERAGQRRASGSAPQRPANPPVAAEFNDELPEFM